MDEDPKVKEAEEYNEAGNCAFKDKEYEKAIRFYDYVFSLYSSSHFRPLNYSLKNLVIIQIVLLLTWVQEIVPGLLQMLRKQWI